MTSGSGDTGSLPTHQYKTFPEVRAGGFSRRDTTIEFFTRVNALIDASSTVLDLGAGRGRAAEDPVGYRRDLQLLRTRVARVVGADVDPAVLENPLLDEAHVIEPGRRLPIEDESIDLVVSDFTFEHIEDPEWAARELRRVLRPNGWICARTPNRWGAIAVPARMVPNALHDRVLARVQPQKQARDTFPTAYRLNTMSALARFFPRNVFEHHSYTYDCEPAYVGDSAVGWWAFLALGALTPPRWRPLILVFLRKRPSRGGES